MKQNEIFAIYGMNGEYFNAIMNSCQQWLDADEWRDYLLSQIGL